RSRRAGSGRSGRPNDDHRQPISLAPLIKRRPLAQAGGLPIYGLAKVRESVVGRASIRSSDDLEIVAARVVPVDAAPAFVVIDLEAPFMHRVGPVVESSLADAGEDPVELGLAD